MQRRKCNKKALFDLTSNTVARLCFHDAFSFMKPNL